MHPNSSNSGDRHAQECMHKLRSCSQGRRQARAGTPNLLKSLIDEGHNLSIDVWRSSGRGRLLVGGKLLALKEGQQGKGTGRRRHRGRWKKILRIPSLAQSVKYVAKVRDLEDGNIAANEKSRQLSGFEQEDGSGRCH